MQYVSEFHAGTVESKDTSQYEEAVSRVIRSAQQSADCQGFWRNYIRLERIYNAVEVLLCSSSFLSAQPLVVSCFFQSYFCHIKILLSKLYKPMEVWNPYLILYFFKGSVGYASSFPLNCSFLRKWNCNLKADKLPFFLNWTVGEKWTSTDRLLFVSALSNSYLSWLFTLAVS